MAEITLNLLTFICEKGKKEKERKKERKKKKR